MSALFLKLRTTSIALLCELLLLMPLAGLVPVKAADSAATLTCPNNTTTSLTGNGASDNVAPLPDDPTTADDLNSGTENQLDPDATDEGVDKPTSSTNGALAPGAKTFADIPAPAADSDPGDGVMRSFQVVNLNDLAANNPFFNKEAAIATIKASGGIQDPTDDSLWDICSLDNLQNLGAPVPVYSDFSLYLDRTSYPQDQIVFDNPQDKYALTGEACTLFDPSTNRCNETKELVTLKDEFGTPLLDADGKPLTELQPKYYDDSAFPNGEWDAPKADLRILQALVYLVTPLSEDGAGREFIRVSRIIQNSDTDNEFASVGATPDPSATVAPTPEPNNQDSAHTYDINHPGSPSKLAQAVDISEIDKVRVTTRIEEKTRLGGTHTSYEYKDFPIKVSWQTDEGVQSAPLVTPNLYQGSLSIFSYGLASLLDSMNLSANIDLSKADVNSFGDIANLIGQSVIMKMLDSPDGSLSGMNFGDLLDKLGRAYLAGQLGLPGDALSEGTTVDELVAHVGQSSIEHAFNFPPGSLSGTSSEDIFQNLGRRELEQVLGVSKGTLSGTTNLSQADLLARLGAGKIEQRFQFTPGSFQTDNWDDVAKIPKTKIYFTKFSTSFTDDSLNLAYQEGSTPGQTNYGFTKEDYNHPSETLLDNTSTFHHFKQLVGARVIETSLGHFNAGTIAAGDFTSGGHPDQDHDFVTSTGKALGLSVISAAGGIDATSEVLATSGAFRVLYRKNSLIEQTGALTHDEIVTIARAYLDDTITKRFSDGCTNVGGGFGISTCPTINRFSTAPAIRDLYNRIVTVWMPQIQTGLARAQVNLDRITQNRAGASTTIPAESVRSTLSSLVGDIGAYKAALLTMLTSQGQSARSAALGVPGTLPTVNADGTISVDSLTSIDPVNAILQGVMSPALFSVVGKAFAAHAFSEDAASTLTMGSLIKTTLQPFTTLERAGINVTSWTNKGLLASDFDRIFMQGLGQEVFKRVGEQELLRTLWKKNDIGGIINSSTGGLATQVGQAVQAYTFYKTRIDRVAVLEKDIEKNLDIATLSGDQRAQIDSLGKYRPPVSTEEVKTQAEQYEALFATLGSRGDKVQADVTEAQKLLREIAAGHELGFDTAGYSANTGNECWNGVQLQGLLRAGTSPVGVIINRIAGCRVDDALGLPAGSAFEWYDAKDYTLAGLTLAIGKTYSRNTGTRLTDDQARAYGKRYLQVAVAGKLLNVAGVGNLQQYGLTAEDIVDLLNGGGQHVLSKIGGAMIDRTQNWPAGTTAAIVDPICRDTSGAITPCSRDAAAQVRSLAIAKVAMKQLGTSLNFPSGFNLFPDPNGPLGKFSFVTNYGISRVSQTLGLATNSFYGTFGDVVAHNDPTQTLTAFGWYSTRADSALDSLSSAFLTSIPSGASSDYQATQSLAASAKDLSRQLRQKVVSQLSDGSSWIWKGDATGANALASFEKDTLATDLLVLESDIRNSNMSNATEQKLVNLLYQYLDIGDVKADEYVANGKTFLARISDLDKIFGLASNSFSDFLTKGTKAEDIATRVGQIELGNTLSDAALDLALKNTPYADLNLTFRNLTVSSTCPDGVSLGNFLLGTATSACSIGNVSLHDVLTSNDPVNIQKRGWLYDKFLSRAWGNKLEQGLGVQSGTLRAMAVEPWRAKEIALDQGVRLMTGQLFKMVDTGGITDDRNRALVQSFKNSFMAGFCPVDPNSTSDPREQAILRAANGTDKGCTFDFKSDRAMVSLHDEMNRMVQARFSSSGFNQNFGLSDIAVVAVGGMDAAYYMAAAQLTQNVNKQLGDDPRAQQFRINYDDIRNAFVGYTTSDKASDATANAAQEDFIYNYYNCYNDPSNAVCSKSGGALKAAYLSDTQVGGSDEDSALKRVETLDTIYKLKYTDSLAQNKQRALTGLQYKLYDIAAFKVDPNIPAGFAYAMLQGTPQQKYRSLGVYLANKLNLGASVFDGILTSEQVADLALYVANGFKGDIKSSSLSALDSWVSKKSNELLGISLPSGTVPSLFAWGATGFDRHEFDTSKEYTIAGGKVASLGTVLKTWGISKVMDWADKALGFQAGSALQIYNAAASVVRASDYLAYAESAAGQMDDLVTNSSVLELQELGYPGAGDYVDSQATARANLKSAQATLISTVINVAFSSQIASLEGSIGLVPGTGSMAVTMLVQLAMGVPVDPVTLGLFLAINLFGVYKVDVTTHATTDGYYPFTGSFGKATSYREYISPDQPTGEFDGMNPTAYHQGLEAGARTKVEGLLRDMLLLPDTYDALYGEKAGYTVFPEQVYTGRVDPLNNLDYLISRNAPWDSPWDYGYGPLERRANVVYDPTTGTSTVTSKDGYRAGYFADPAFNGDIHIRF